MNILKDIRTELLKSEVKIRDTRYLSLHRRALANILSKSNRTIPHASGIGELDVTNLMEWYERVKEDAENDGVRITITAVIIKVFAEALARNPMLNAFFEYNPWRTRGMLHLCEDVNIMFTIDTPKGVLSPVIRNADKKSLYEIARNVDRLARVARVSNINKALQGVMKKYVMWSLIGLRPLMWVETIRHIIFGLILRKAPKSNRVYQEVPEEDRIRPEDLVGATFTLTNPGMRTRGVPTNMIVIPPLVAVVGIGEVRKMPVVIDDKIEIRSIMRMGMSIDHRALDGGPVFKFTEALRDIVSNPAKYITVRETSNGKQPAKS